MGARERLEAREAATRKKKQLPAWREGLEDDVRKAFDEACQAFADLREGGSRLGVPALVDIVEEDCGKRWAAKTISEYLDTVHGDGWR